MIRAFYGLTQNPFDARELPSLDDPDAIELMHKLSRKSRKRWPEFADAAPRFISTGPVTTS